MNELVERNRRNRKALLCHLYAASGGDIYKRVDMSEFGESLGLTFKEIYQVMTHLIEAGLARGDGSGALMLRITLPGILEAEALLSTSDAPTEYRLVDTIASLQHQLLQRQSNLNKLQGDAAIFGAGEVPLRLQNQIEAEKEAIEKIQAMLDYEA